MNENLDIQELLKEMKNANRLAAIKELYQLGELDKENYCKILKDYLKNN